MKDLKRILCPVELLEDFGEETLEYASSIAKKFDGEILLLYISPSVSDYDDASNIMILSEEIAPELLKEAKEMMDELSTHSVFENVPVRTMIKSGLPANQIVRTAVEEDSDLIVISTHGREGIDRLFFGSVAEKVVLMSPVPVFIVRPKE